MLKNINVEYLKSSVELIISVLKTIVIMLSTYYTNFKLSNKKIALNNITVIKIFILLIISGICGVIKYRINYLISLIGMILLISIIFSTKNISKSILTTIISISINYTISFVTVILSFIINYKIELNNDYINLFIIILIHIIILHRFLKLKKLKYGLSFLQKRTQKEYIDILVLNICIIILFFIIILVNCSTVLENITFGRDLIVGIIISISIMFITIQKSLQLYYKQKLLIKELEETKEKLAKKAKEVEDLELDNLNISKKSHTLVHKQKSLEYKLQEIMNKTEISKEEAAEVRDRLKEIEKDLYKEKATIELSKTGIPQIDDIFRYMLSECKKNKIEFELQINGNIHYMTNNLISISDLETLLADHIKNAIIAINHIDNVNRSILVRLGEIDGNYSLYIYDSGIEFEKETLENLGKKPSTTHADEGGTGMGFMNTFDTLRKCKASLIIEEFNEPSKDNYTKVLMIKFDNKNEFSIKSYRRNPI